MPGLGGVAARSTAVRAAAVVKSSSGSKGCDPILPSVLHAMHSHRSCCLLLTATAASLLCATRTQSAQRTFCCRAGVLLTASLGGKELQLPGGCRSTSTHAESARSQQQHGALSANQCNTGKDAAVLAWRPQLSCMQLHMYTQYIKILWRPGVKVALIYDAHVGCLHPLQLQGSVPIHITCMHHHETCMHPSILLSVKQLRCPGCKPCHDGPIHRQAS